MMDELPPETHTHGILEKKGKLVTFYRNGDRHFKGVTVPISQKWFVTLETLIVYLNGKISTPTGIRYIFNLSTSQEVGDVHEFEPGENYVVSSVKRLIHDTMYGDSGEKPWINKPPSASRVRKTDRYLFTNSQGLLEYKSHEVTPRKNHPSLPNSSKTHRLPEQPISKQSKPLQIIVVSNSNRDSMATLSLENISLHRFEDLLFELSNYLQISRPPIQTLYTTTKPFRRVCSYNQLTKEASVNHSAQFIACGSEFYPKEIEKSIKTQRLKKPAIQKIPTPIKQQKYQNSFSNAESSTATSNESSSSNKTYQTISTQTDEENNKRSIKDQQLPNNHHKETQASQSQNLPKREEEILTQPRKQSQNYKSQTHKTSLMDENAPVYGSIRGVDRVFYPPKNKSNIRTRRSDSQSTLSINWIYGFNAHLSGCNCIDAISTDEVAYAVGKIIIIYNLSQYKQKYFLEHSNPISCFRVHSNQKLIASAQSWIEDSNETECTIQQFNDENDIYLNNSTIYIWEISDCTVLHIITQGSLSPIIYSLDFAIESGTEYLLVLEGTGTSQINQTQSTQFLSIYSWKNPHHATTGVDNVSKVVNSRCNKTQAVYEARFHQDDSSFIVTRGEAHMSVWRVFWGSKTKQNPRNVDEGGTRILRDKKSGNFEFCTPDMITTICFDLLGNLLTGDSNGTLHLWVRDDEDAFVNKTPPLLFHAHKDSLSCIVVMGDGTVVTTSEFCIRSWDSFHDFKFIKERTISNQFGKIKCIVPCHPESVDGKLWLATDLGFILEGSMQDQFSIVVPGISFSSNFLASKAIMSSRLPTQDEAHCYLCLATSPIEHCFVSAGSDKCVKKWSMLQQKIMWSVNLDSVISSLVYHPDGQLILVGTDVGKLIVVKSGNGAHVMSLQIDSGQSTVTCLSISPDKKILGVGCKRSDLKLFSILDGGSFYRQIANIEMRGTMNTKRIDWSEGDKHIRIEDADFNTRSWQLASSLKELGPIDASFVNFTTENCLATYHNLGLWNNSKIEELSVVHRLLISDHIIYGTVSGKVVLTKLPTNKNEKELNQVHSISNSEIQYIQSAFDNSFIFTSSVDLDSHPTIIQWNLTSN